LGVGQGQTNNIIFGLTGINLGSNKLTYFLILN